MLGKSTFPPGGENNLPVWGEGLLFIMEFVPDLLGVGVTFLKSCVYLVYMGMVALGLRKICRSLLSPSTMCVFRNQTWVISLGHKCIAT